MAVPVNPATLFAAGVILDIITALYYVALNRERLFAATVINFACVEFGYISYIYVIGNARLEDNLNNIHWYAAGCAAGTLAGLAFATWHKRRQVVPDPKPKPRCERHEALYLTTTESRILLTAAQVAKENLKPVMQSPLPECAVLVRQL